MFNEILKKLRETKNISQLELTQSLGISKSTIGMYELGKRMPNDKILKKIADYFSVSIDFLLGFESKKNLSLTDKEESIITKYREQPQMQSAVDKILGIE